MLGDAEQSGCARGEQLGAQRQATAWSSGTTPFHLGDALSSQEAVSPPDLVLPRLQATPGRRGPDASLAKWPMPLLDCGAQRAPSPRAGHEGPQAAAGRAPRCMAMAGGLGRQSHSGREGAWARESVLCGLNLKCMMVADRGRHAQPGTSPWTLLRPGLRRGAAPAPPRPCAAASLPVCVTQPGAVPRCGRPGPSGVSPLSEAHETGCSCCHLAAAG